MVLAAKRAGVTLMVHENFRWQSAIDKGAIGTPFWGRVSFRSTYDVCTGQPYLSTDDKFIIQDLGIHIIDVARVLFGDVTPLVASTKRVNHRIRAEDVATMLLVHAGGVTSVVDCSYATRLPHESFPETLLEVDGSEGTLRLSPGYRLTIHNAAGTEEIDVSPPCPHWAERPWHNIQESVCSIEQHFADCLAERREPETSVSDNLWTLALVYAAHISAAEGNRAVATGDVARC